MFDHEHDKRKDWDRSEALWHYKERYNRLEEKQPDNYEPHWSEKDEETKPREVLHMGHSYGDVSLAVNRRKELTLTVSEKRRHNSKTLNSDHQRLKGQRRRTVAGPLGWAFTNSFNPQESAFAFKTGKIQPARRVMQQIKRYVDRRDQHTVERMLPFLHLDEDKERLHRLRSDTGGVREEVQEELGLDRVKERLAGEVVRKEQLRRQFMKKFQQSIRKARELADDYEPAWLKHGMPVAGLGKADTTPGEEGGGPGEPLNEAVPEEGDGEKKL